MRISVIIKIAPNGGEHPKLKLYTSLKEWTSWGKPSTFVPSGTIETGLTLTWTSGEAARKWSVHNESSIQGEMSGAFLPARGIRATITPTELTLIEQTKTFVRFAPFDPELLPYKPAGAVQRRKSPRPSPLVTHLHGKAKANGQISLDKLRDAVATINNGLPENAVLELTDGSRRLRIMLEIV